MKRILLAAALLAVPARAYSQANCAIQAPSPQAAPAHSAAVPKIKLPKPVDVTGPAIPLAPAVTSASQSPDATPDLFKHVVAAGAKISDLGFSHGLKSVVARNGDQFLVFAVTPDNQAMISGLMVDIDLQTLRKIGGAGISELATQHGVRSFFLRNGQHFQVFYATPDEQRVIPGVMWDAAGKNITRQQIASIPGTTPTVTLGNVDQKGGASADALQLAQSSAFGSVGDSHAPDLWMIVDPQCSFSIKAMQQLNPYVMAGRIHLNVIPVSVLDHEDNGLSTRRAVQLLSMKSDAIVPAWETGATTGIGADGDQRLQNNMAMAQSIGLRGTPTLLWKNADGSTGRADGLPNDLEAVIRSIKG